MVDKINKDNNSGDTEFQIKNFTNRINSINKHLSTMKKDHSGRRGLLIMVSKRKRLLNYLKKNDLNKYNEVLKKYNLRK